MESIRQRCTAHRTNGQPCNNWAIKGGNVCRIHGGGAPQVKARAQERLQEMVVPALAKMTQLIHSKQDAVALGTCKDILDRTGHKPTEKIEVVGDILAAIERGSARAKGK